jgi:hypothetical protein
MAGITTDDLEDTPASQQTVHRQIARNPVIPSAPANAAPAPAEQEPAADTAASTGDGEEEEYQPTVAQSPDRVAPKQPTLIPTGPKVWRNTKTGATRTDRAPGGGEPGPNVEAIRKNYEALKDYDRKMERFNASTMFDAQQQERRQVNQETRNTLKDQRVQTEVDPETGLVKPVTDEEGKVQFRPGKGPVEYDKDGRAVQTQWEPSGPKRVALDANAKPVVYPNDPTRIYRDNKHAGPEYLGTLEEGLKSTDPAIKQAAEAAGWTSTGNSTRRPRMSWAKTCMTLRRR